MSESIDELSLINQFLHPFLISDETQRKLVFATNFNFVIPKPLQPDFVDH